MNHAMSLDRAAETLEQLCQLWKEKREAAANRPGPPPRPFTIALSRQAGTQGVSVAKETGARLGWHVYDYDLLEKIAKEMGLRTSLLESVDEKHGSFLMESLGSFLALPLVNRDAYVRHLIETALALGTHGECIIVGRGSVHILPAATTLRVCLIAPLKDRIDVCSRNLGIPRPEAAKQVDSTDHERIRFNRDYFLKDATDPHNYDIILNTARFSVTECADLIVEALHRMQARAVAASRETPAPTAAKGP